MTAKPENYHREREARLKAERKCLRCRAGLLDTERYQACTLCLERMNKRRATRRSRALDAAAAKRRYHANPELARQKARTYRQKKQREGICRDCSLDALANSDFCQRHRLERAAMRRVYYLRAKARWADFCAQWAFFATSRRVRVLARAA